jgi:hypothetical protein
MAAISGDGLQSCGRILQGWRRTSYYSCNSAAWGHHVGDLDVESWNFGYVLGVLELSIECR